jgi:nucleotide-binding universal stress UspA family protein
MIRDVVALLDGSTGDSLPLEHSERIARLFGANLTALYLNVLPDVVTSGQSTISPMAIDQLMATSKSAGAAAATRLSAQLQGAGVPAVVRRVDTADNELWNLVSNASRAADLFVVKHPGREGAQRQDRLVAEAALFGSARGVYLAESPVPSERMYRSVIVAWDNSHSAARALTEALPFLQKSHRTLVVTVDGARAAEPTATVQDDSLVRHLAHLGLAATYRRVNARGRSVSDVLLREITSADADLLVMGAYGHSRLREWLFGSVTRDFLTHSPVPVLMAR